MIYSIFDIFCGQSVHAGSEFVDLHADTSLSPCLFGTVFSAFISVGDLRRWRFIPRGCKLKVKDSFYHGLKPSQPETAGVSAPPSALLVHSRMHL